MLRPNLCLVISCCALLLRFLSSKRTVIITGSNRGIGLSAARLLAASNEWQVVLACRSKDKAQAALTSISKGNENIEIMQLDLSDLRSVKDFARSWGSRPIDCLALNAGIQTGSSGVPSRSKQGFESSIAINHIGHFYLMNLLLSNVKKSSKGRVVIVGSGVHNPDEAGGNVGSKATLGDLDGFKGGFKNPFSMVDGGSFDPDKAYKDSKLCNVMTCLELARRLKAQRSLVTANVMNPGLIPTTGLFREFNPLFVAVFTFLTRYVFKVAASEEEGGARLAFMISSPDLNAVSGTYYSGRPGQQEYVPIEPSNEAKDQKKATLLWTLTESLIRNERL